MKNSEHFILYYIEELPFTPYSVTVLHLFLLKGTEIFTDDMAGRLGFASK